MRHAIDGNGGLRLRFGADDKGLILLAGWGLQSRSFEDNAVRSLTAAAMIEDAVQAARFAVSVGVTGGKVFAGLVGSDRHREYTVIGDPVNRAAALSDGATGQTRVDAQTREAGAIQFAFSDAGIFALKGQDPAPHFVMIAEATGQTDHKGEMVGRRAERDAVDAVDAVVASLTAGTAPGVVQIIGDAGLGKSRLAGYLHSRLTEAGIAPLRMNADSLRRTTGFYPWRQLVGALLDGDADTGILAGHLAQDPAMIDLLPLLRAFQRLSESCGIPIGWFFWFPVLVRTWGIGVDAATRPPVSGPPSVLPEQGSGFCRPIAQT